MAEFVDKERKGEDKLREAESLLKEGRVEEFKERLRRMIEEDPYFLKPHVLLSEVYEMEGEIKKAEQMLKETYERAKELIAREGRLPDRLEWKHPSNRHILEALLSWGVFLWELGRVDEALEVLREIYLMNPADEQGVRFYILAILEGMSFDEFEQTFSRDGEYDYEDLSKWFEKHSKEHELFRVFR